MECKCQFLTHSSTHYWLTGVHVFKTSVLYEIDGDDSIGSSHAVGKSVAKVYMNF